MRHATGGLGATWDRLNLRIDVYAADWKLPIVTKLYGCGRGKPAAWWLTQDACDSHPVRLLSSHSAQTRAGRIVPIMPPLMETMRRCRKSTRNTPDPYGNIFRYEDGAPIPKKTDTEAFSSLRN